MIAARIFSVEVVPKCIRVGQLSSSEKRATRVVGLLLAIDRPGRLRVGSAVSMEKHTIDSSTLALCKAQEIGRVRFCKYDLCP
jgi:hypothetical protein